MWKDDCVNKYNPIINEDEKRVRLIEKQIKYRNTHREEINKKALLHYHENKEKLNQKRREKRKNKKLSTI